MIANQATRGRPATLGRGALPGPRAQWEHPVPKDQLARQGPRGLRGRLVPQVPWAQPVQRGRLVPRVPWAQQVQRDSRDQRDRQDPRDKPDRLA